jgi:hypothetical protein
MVSLRASTERLTNYLDQFIKLDTDDLEQELTKEEEEEMKEKYRTSIMLTQHINQKTSLEDFKYLIEEAGLEKEWTVTLVSDFDHHEEQNMISKVKKYQGVCKTVMNAPKPITNILDKEDNSIYAVFSDPIKAYQYYLEFVPVATTALGRTAGQP